MYDVAGAIIDYESGDMEPDQAVVFFQYLIDTGLAWTLQGAYGRTAHRLIELGHCHLKREPNGDGEVEA